MRLLFLLTPCILFAQIQDLATTGDGQVVYFSTQLRQKGTTQSLYSKLLAVDASGLRLVAAADPGDRIPFTTANFYILNNPEVSTDGSVIAYTAGRLCSSPSSCLMVETHQAVIGERKMAGRATISRNGRYALNYGWNWFGSVSGVQGNYLVDLTTGQSVNFAGNIGYIVHRGVSNDGGVLFIEGTGFVWWKGGVRAAVTVPEPAGTDSAPLLYRLNDAGTKFAYIGRSRTLWLVDIAAGTATTVATGVAGVPFGISGDISRIVFAKAVDGVAQPMLSEGGTVRQLASLPDGVNELTLSDDGKIVYAATGDGRLLRLDIAGGSVEELIPRTPAILAVRGPSAPGSAVQMLGTGVGAARVLMNGTEVPVLAAAADHIWFQVPSDTPVGTVAITLAPGDSPLESGEQQLEILSFAPAFLIGDVTTNYYAIAAHEDFGSLVTVDHSAVPGEAIHLWMTGLGAVDNGSPARITAPMTCTFATTSAELLYAGVAPGMNGFYQVDVRVPSGLKSSPASITCGVGVGSASGFASVPVVTTGG